MPAVQQPTVTGRQGYGRDGRCAVSVQLNLSRTAVKSRSNRSRIALVFIALTVPAVEQSALSGQHTCRPNHEWDGRRRVVTVLAVYSQNHYCTTLEEIESETINHLTCRLQSARYCARLCVGFALVSAPRPGALHHLPYCKTKARH